MITVFILHTDNINKYNLILIIIINRIILIIIKHDNINYSLASFGLI